MSEPTKTGFELVPNNDGDDPKIAKAVELYIQRALEKRGLRVTDPGAIPQDAIENPDRAARLAEAANAAMKTAADASMARHRPLRDRTQASFHVSDTMRVEGPDGEVRERTIRIDAAIQRTQINVGDLSKLLDSVKDLALEVKGWVASGYGVCAKLFKGALEAIRSDGGSENVEPGDSGSYPVQGNPYNPSVLEPEDTNPFGGPYDG